VNVREFLASVKFSYEAPRRGLLAELGDAESAWNAPDCFNEDRQLAEGRTAISEARQMR